MALFSVNIDEVEDIIAIRTAIIKGSFVETGGIVIVNWNSEGTSVSKQWAVSAATLLEETKDYLQEYDPDLYGKRIRRTSPGYLV